MGIGKDVWEIVAAVRHNDGDAATNNLHDYRPLHADAITPGGPGHFGMIFMSGGYRHTKPDIGRIVSALDAKLAEYPDDEDPSNGESWL